MAVAAMSALAPMGVFVPSTPMVVKREKRRRRRNQPTEAAADSHASKRRRSVRQGFVFDAPTQEDDAPVSTAPVASTASSAASAFTFRVRKASAKEVDAAHATDALLQKQLRAREREQKRQRLAQRQAQREKDAQVEAALENSEQKLSRDQMTLYYAVRDQVKREMRKTMRDFARSAARADILQLTEKSLEAIKVGVVDFLKTTPPSQTMETVPNPENARLKALIESYETRIQELEKEETQWTTMRDALEAASPSYDATTGHTSSQKHVELRVTTEIGKLQKAAITEVETSAQRLQAIEDSMKSIDRLALQAEIQKSKLFDAFHDSAFKGYVRTSNESLRALLKLAPTTTTSQ